MNLKNLVESLTISEREELLNILSNDSATWTTMPPHIKEMLNEEIVKEENKNVEDFTMKKTNSNVNNKREAVQAKTNTWSDVGEDRHITTPDAPRTPRNRKPPQKKEVTCHVCGKKNKVNAALIYGEYYRCDSCAS